MYGNYGRQEDLRVLEDRNVSLEGSVLLLRAGSISFAEQVGVASAEVLMWRSEAEGSFCESMCSRLRMLLLKEPLPS